MLILFDVVVISRTRSGRLEGGVSVAYDGAGRASQRTTSSVLVRWHVVGSVSSDCTYSVVHGRILSLVMLKEASTILTRREIEVT
jgi:hypothetical protein